MTLFKINDSELRKLNLKSFQSEKQIQNIVEENCTKIFNIQFLATEFTVGRFRLDSVCFDHETNSFVIIEYKKGHSYSVIDQGFTYLNSLHSNKSDFVLMYNEITNSSLKTDEIEWSQSKILFISPSFNTFQKESVNFKDIPFELWEISQYDSGIYSLNQINSSSQKNSIMSVKPSIDNKSVLKEIIYDEESILSKTSDVIKSIYKSINNSMCDWNDLNFKATKHYISIRKGTKNLAYLNVRKDKIILHIYHKVNFSGNVDTSPIMFELDDPRKLFDMYRDSRREIYTFTIESDKELDYIISSIKQKYDDI